MKKPALVYEINCPGCYSKHVGKTERRLDVRLSEHYNPDKSAFGNHLTNCEQAQHIINLRNLEIDSLLLFSLTTLTNLKM